MHNLVNKPASLTEIKDFLSQPRVTGSPRLWRGRMDIRLLCIKKYGRTQEAIEETLKICADKNLLTEYLKTREAEVRGIMRTLFDQERVTELYGIQMRKEGMRIGEARGRTEGIFSTLSGLVKDGILTVPQAAARMNISASEFRQRTGALL
ncbi:MAG: hypothetical protein Q4E17_07260 [Synergistes sp.]|nr:hypothetical protein [Synergistes sp.]